MHIKIIAIGKEQDKNMLNMIKEYTKRFPWKIQWQECKSIANKSVDVQKEKEGEILLSHVKDEVIIALDENGKNPNSIELSHKIQQYALQGKNRLSLLIGGANGHGNNVKQRAHYTLSLSNLTFPHKLVRLILAEQLYRAYTIIQKHPYHKK